MLTQFLSTMTTIRYANSPDEMIREQYKSLTRLVPVLYLVCLFACIAIVVAFSNGAPAWLGRWIPLSLGVVMLVRHRYWVSRRGTEETADIAAIRRDMRGTEFLGPALATGFSIYSVAMLGYASNEFEESLLVVTVWITAIASAFCLAVLPLASTLVVAGAALPLILAFGTSGNPQMMVLAGLFTIISAMMIFMLHNSFRTFSEILSSRTQMVEKQRQTEAARQAVTQMAYTDALTDLPNRRHFERMLSERVALSEGQPNKFIVGMIDLDGFKPINDVYGHVVGDEVLVEAARRIRRAMSDIGTAARVGGDEFAIIVDHHDDVETAGLIARKLRDVFHDPITIGAITTRLSCSCGFSMYPASGHDAARLIDRADMALYRAKAQDRGGFAIFSASFEDAACERAMIEQELRHAIAGDQLTVHFQPILDLAHSHLVGFEALARWNHPKMGQVSPAVFVPIAEQTGLIDLMTTALLRKAARIAARWPSHLVLSFNLSAYQLDKPNAGLKIIGILAECGLPPHRFEAEITETAILRNISASRATIEALKAAGVRISLDDFGTGFSSLSHVKDLPLDKIKIDKSFVDRVCTDEKIGNIVRSIINMCEFLDLACVAEGIERKDQLDFLKDNNCSGGQGYLFSRPIPTDRVDTLLDEIAERVANGKPATTAKAA